MARTIDYDHPDDKQSIWIRGLTMLLFTVAFALAETILAILTLLQFVWLLVAREPNRFIHDFGRSLSKWISDVIRFQTCVTNERPFPWKNWPTPGEDTHQPDFFSDADNDTE